MVRKNSLLVKEAKNFMEQWKYEIANELGIQAPKDGYWGNLTSRDCGAVGGQMVKKMIEMAEQNLVKNR